MRIKHRMVLEDRSQHATLKDHLMMGQYCDCCVEGTFKDSRVPNPKQ